MSGYRYENFSLMLKYSEKAAFEQKFAFTLVIFCSHAAGNFTLIF